MAMPAAQKIVRDVSLRLVGMGLKMAPAFGQRTAPSPCDRPVRQCADSEGQRRLQGPALAPIRPSGCAPSASMRGRHPSWHDHGFSSRTTPATPSSTCTNPRSRRRRKRRAVDEVVGTPVEALIFNLGYGNAFLHGTEVADRWGPTAAATEIFRPGGGEKWNHLVFQRAYRNAEKLIAEGNDPLRLVCDRAHEKGLLVYPSLQMAIVLHKEEDRAHTIGASGPVPGGYRRQRRLQTPRGARRTPGHYRGGGVELSDRRLRAQPQFLRPLPFFSSRRGRKRPRHHDRVAVPGARRGEEGQPGARARRPHRQQRRRRPLRRTGSGQVDGRRVGGRGDGGKLRDDVPDRPHGRLSPARRGGRGHRLPHRRRSAQPGRL